MADDDAGADAGPIDIVQISSDRQSMSVTEAARALASARLPKDEKEPGAVDPPPAVEDTAPEADAAPPEEGPGETEGTDPAAEPPIEPPRSWTKEEKDRFATLPRETQEYLTAREKDRERTFLQSQNETAEQRKATAAERTKLEQARTQYESALPALMQTLQDQQAGEFSDIKTVEDVTKLAREDWPRYIQWDASQKRLAAVQQQVEAATQRQYQEKQTKLAEFVAEQAKLFAEKVPEIADKDTREKLQGSAVKMLQELGFTESELGELWRGEKEISLHDHRLQLILRDGIRYQQAQAAAKTAAKKPVPPVQRPGAAPPRGALQTQNLDNLTKQLERTGSLKDAARLLAERRRAAN